MKAVEFFYFFVGGVVVHNRDRSIFCFYGALEGSFILISVIVISQTTLAIIRSDLNWSVYSTRSPRRPYGNLLFYCDSDLIFTQWVSGGLFYYLTPPDQKRIDSALSLSLPLNYFFLDMLKNNVPNFPFWCYKFSYAYNFIFVQIGRIICGQAV